MKKQINIEGMGCNNCKMHVESSLRSVPGVTRVLVSLKENNAVVETSSNVAEKRLIEAIEQVGYEVSGILTLEDDVKDSCCCRR